MDIWQGLPVGYGRRTSLLPDGGKSLDRTHMHLTGGNNFSSHQGLLRRDREEKEREIREGEEREMLKNMSAEERAAWERDHPKVLYTCCRFIIKSNSCGSCFDPRCNLPPRWPLTIGQSDNLKLTCQILWCNAISAAWGLSPGVLD